MFISRWQYWCMFDIMKKRLRTIKYTEYIKPPTNKKDFCDFIKRIKKKESIYYLLFETVSIQLCTINELTNFYQQYKSE